VTAAEASPDPSYALEDDPRIVGALQAAENLADLVDAAAARNALGLKSGATTDVSIFQLSSDTSHADNLHAELLAKIETFQSQLDEVKLDLIQSWTAHSQHVDAITKLTTQVLAAESTAATSIKPHDPVPIAAITPYLGGQGNLQSWLADNASKIEQLRGVLVSLGLVTDA
jgi:hypothetical protein